MPEEQNNLEKQKEIFGSGCSGQGIESRSLMVDFPTISTQWENADHRIRRLHQRLGERTVADGVGMSICWS